MDAGTVLIIVAIVFIVLMACEVPIAFVLALSGAVGILLTRGWDVTTAAMGNTPFTAVANYSLSIVPMYILVGVFAVFARIAEHVYMVADRLLYRVRGGLGVATIMACAGFAAVSGSSVATAATIGRLSIEEMRKRGYPDTLAAALVAAAGTLGILIPPSIILAIYGILTRISIADLLAAGILPGMVEVLVYTTYIVIKGPGRKQRLSDVSTRPLRDLPWRGVLRVGVIFALVMAGIYSGVFTVTESGALGALFALVFMVVELRPEGIQRVLAVVKAAFLEVAAVTSMSFFIFIGSSIFTFFLVSAGIPTAFVRWVTGLEMNPTLIVAVLLLVLVPLGMFLDSLSILVIFVPITFPVVAALGFNGIWFGILVVCMIELGQITPPVGINAYVVSGISGIPPERVFRGVWPFTALDIMISLIIFVFPPVVLFLPNLVGS
jgi:tripartite ATP-independent transporter DctM subunit